MAFDAYSAALTAEVTTLKEELVTMGRQLAQAVAALSGQRPSSRHSSRKRASPPDEAYEAEASRGKRARRELNSIEEEPSTAEAEGGSGGPSRPPGATRAAAAGDDSDHSSSSSSEHIENTREVLHHRYRSRTTSPRRFLTHDIAFVRANHIQQKDTPCAEPVKFDMKRGRDFRPYVDSCERYMKLRFNRFPSERSRILWAIGYLQGERAQT